MTKRLLFIAPNRIGDAVLSTGLLSYLIETNPGVAVTVAAGPASAPLFGGVPGLERIIIVRKRRYSLHWLTLWRTVVGMRWDIVVDLRRSAISYCLRVGRRLVPEKKSGEESQVRVLSRLVDRIDHPVAPRLWWRDSHDANAERLFGAVTDGRSPVLAIGPTANWQGKVWPAERFAELIERLTADDGLLPHAPVAIFGGPDERLQANPVLRAVPRDRRIDLVGKVDLLTAAACLSRCRVYVGNDSGLMHMAAAVGVPTLGLFGPSRTEVYAPWGAHARALRTPESFEELVGGPNYDRHTVGSLMTGLDVETVLEGVNDLLNVSSGVRALSGR